MWLGFCKTAAFYPGQDAEIPEFSSRKMVMDYCFSLQTFQGHRDFQAQTGGLQVFHHRILKLQFWYIAMGMGDFEAEFFSCTVFDQVVQVYFSAELFDLALQLEIVGSEFLGFGDGYEHDMEASFLS